MHHAGRVIGMALIMCNHDYGSSITVQLAQEFEYFFAIRCIEVTGRFVSENQLGIGDNCSCHGDTLLLTARQLLRSVIGTMRNTDAFQDRLNPFLPLACRYLLIQQRQHDVFSNSQFINKIKALKYETDIVFANFGQLRFRIAGDIFASEFVAATVRRIEHAKNVQQSGLATT